MVARKGFARCEANVFNDDALALNLPSGLSDTDNEVARWISVSMKAVLLHICVTMDRGYGYNSIRLSFESDKNWDRCVCRRNSQIVTGQNKLKISWMCSEELPGFNFFDKCMYFGAGLKGPIILSSQRADRRESCNWEGYLVHEKAAREFVEILYADFVNGRSVSESF